MGSVEGQSPFARGLGVSPKPKSPQDREIKGVEKRVINNF
jgi:hypothetical protein